MINHDMRFVIFRFADITAFMCNKPRFSNSKKVLMRSDRGYDRQYIDKKDGKDNFILVK